MTTEGSGEDVEVAVSQVIASTLNELGHNLLTQRERGRIDEAVRSAQRLISERSGSGENIRSDDFFKGKRGESIGDDVLEGILLAAKNDHDRKKATHLGYLFGNACFESELDRYVVNWCVDLASSLSWTQMVLLEIVAGRGSDRLPDGDISGSGDASFGWRSWSIRNQLLDLGWGQKGVIVGQQRKTERMGLPLIDTTFKGQRLANPGSILRFLLRLDRIEQSEIDGVIEALNSVEPSEGES